MGMVRSALFIFETVDTYSCSYNKGYFKNLKEKTFLRKLNGIEKGLEISGFGIVEYSVISESRCMITLRSQA